MVTTVLVVIGLCLGSFINALVWRLYEQNKSKVSKKDLSILHGRSMCPHCKHELAKTDLIPLFSWLSLRGKCRYCHKPISAQYPLVELTTALLFVFSYIWWPNAISDSPERAIFILWLAILTGLIALIVYDLSWLLLPDRIIFPLGALAAVQATIIIVSAGDPVKTLINTALAVLFGGGIFYLLFQLSAGKWIGGGDVKLGWLLGLIVGTPARSLLFIFLAAILGSLTALPLLWSGRLKRNSVIPFGPFLIVGAIVTVLFGHDILNWYQQTFINI